MGILDTLLAPESRKEAALEQSRMKEQMSSRVAEHPAKVKYLHGMARANQLTERMVGVDVNNVPALLRDRLAESLSHQTRFADAAQVAVTPAYKATYQERADAVAALDVRRCQCPPVIVEASPRDAKGVRRESATTIEEVFDGSRVIVLSRCRLCQTLSAHAR